MKAVKDKIPWLFLAMGHWMAATATVSPGHQQEELVTVRAGKNITLECIGRTADQEVRWEINNMSRSRVGPTGSLIITEADPETDNGVYSCFYDTVRLRRVRVVVQSTPAAVANLTVIPHSVFALVTWTLKENHQVATGGFVIQKFILTYKMISSHFDHDQVEMAPPDASASKPVVVDDIEGDATSKTVYNLRPNSSYSFSLCAVNELGDGLNLTLVADTLYSQDEVDQARRLYFQSRQLNYQQNLSRLVQIVLIAVCVVLVVVALPGGITLLLCNKGCTGNSVRPDLVCEATEEEEMELVPHITLNPSFNIDMLEYIEPSPDQEDVDHDTANLMTTGGSRTARNAFLSDSGGGGIEKNMPNG